MRKGTPARALRRTLLHLALAAGSIVFSLPFFWLVSTSAKSPDEMYPPRWLPGVPPDVIESPYMALRENERPVRPTRVAEDDWIRLYDAIIEGLRAKSNALAPVLPAFYSDYLDDEALAAGLFNRILKRAPDELFEKIEPVAVDWFSAQVTPELVEEVFDTVYRRAGVSDIVVYGWDSTLESPTRQSPFPWRMIGGDATLVLRDEGLPRPAQEIHYSFSTDEPLMLEAIVPLEMDAENVKKIVLSMHCDRSWHKARVSFELGGRRYEATRLAFWGSDRWQDTAYQFPSDNDYSVMFRNWIDLEYVGPTDEADSGSLRIVLEVERAGLVGATANKYANNFIDVFQRVPLYMYVRNSVVLVVLNVLGQILASSLVAFAFARLRWPGRDSYFVIVLATLMIPAQVTMIPVFLIFKELGWYNTLRPMWLPAFFGSAFYIFLLRQFMKGIPRDLEDSAKIDGSGYLGIYARVILPLIKPALAAIGIFTFLGTWNEFMAPLIYLSDQELYPLSLGLFALQAFLRTNFGLMMAASVIMTTPIILLFFAAQRHFIQGITLTGMKG